eukprot:TRINITY_DN4823_c0_g1_i2.p2 TRINITY_DN4823_c0_g1~~TRINITY_DN4823_c0_g1_i2.p2  ORF type:complete len:105 (+),score=4.82 TRINITY_DN4823_c0_g1_i2:328-642(+)
MDSVPTTTIWRACPSSSASCSSADSSVHSSQLAVVWHTCLGANFIRVATETTAQLSLIQSSTNSISHSPPPIGPKGRLIGAYVLDVALLVAFGQALYDSMRVAT